MESSNNPLSREYEKRLSQMSPFEIKNELISLAQEDWPPENRTTRTNP